MSSAAVFEVKNKLTDFVRQVESGEPLEITRHGKPVAVLMGISEFERMKRERSGFGLSFRRYRESWDSALCAESAVEYDDPFEGIRPQDSGRNVVL